MPLQQPIHPGEMLAEHMHDSEISTRSPPPPYSREVEQAVPDSTTDWDENSWNNQSQDARQTAGPGRLDDRRDSSAAEEDAYRDGLDVDPLGAFRDEGEHPHSTDSSPITDQRR